MSKIYEHNGRKFKLREKFYVKDIEITTRIDRLFAKAKIDNGEVTNNITKDEFAQFLCDVLIPEDGEPVDPAFFDDMPHTEAMEIFLSFFIVYLQNSMSMQTKLAEFEKSLSTLRG